MKLLSREMQIVLREEIKKETCPIGNIEDYIIHHGLGHTVFNADLIHEDENKEEILNFIKSNNDYFYRLSFTEDCKEKDENKVKIYLTRNLKFFQPKKSDNDIYHFLDLDFFIIELGKIGYSESYKSNKYRCKIISINIDKYDGTITEKELCNKVKYGRLENYLSAELDKFKPFIINCRKRIEKK